LNVVEMKGITKRFPNVLANDHIDFCVNSGEIHALLGENGAGKTTLMNILFGLYQPDEGQILLDKKRVTLRSPRDAIKLGIGMVHQHFKLVETNTVAENIVLCLQIGGVTNPMNFFRLLQNPLHDVEQRVKDLSNEYRLKVDPRAKIWQLSLGEQQRVEIIKTMFQGVNILILDEPTSVLAPKEVDDLFNTLHRMADEGHAIVFISHKLDEVLRISDRITVLRNGRVMASLITSKTDKNELARLMVGRDVLFRLEKKQTIRSEPVLEVKNLEAFSDKGGLALKNITFKVFSREILGIAGVSGNGQKELTEVLTGLRKSEKGEVNILGVNVTNSSPIKILNQGVAHIPEERIKVGTVPNMSVSENLFLRRYNQHPFSNGFCLKKDIIRQHSEKLIREYNIATPSTQTPIKLLSGGNIQKLIIARETSWNPKLIIASHPTYGLDVGATEQIRRLLLKQRETGVAILLISEDLTEILSLSDRIIVMFNGEFVGETIAETANIEKIGLMMAGVRDA